VCDLSGLDAVAANCTGVFASVTNHPASHWPGTAFMLCSPRPAVDKVLRTNHVRRFVAVHANLELAIREVFRRPPYLRDEIRVVPNSNAPATARQFVLRTCRHWRLTEPSPGDVPAEPDRAGVADDEAGERVELMDRALLITSELVTNAVVHGGSGSRRARRRPAEGDELLRVRVELRGDRLYISVLDDNPPFVRPAQTGPDAESGRGLLLVDWLATAWGVRDGGNGGKLVWAALHID
jgi:hypothetical protein